ncbi:hypothetical protein [Desmospora activa]|uniref:hypothetical protein n=1 Tax=Desmospora activa TaxID=500615 RepID=UPI001473B9E5|nr:hypothetical protein [Desmospora activa]
MSATLGTIFMLVAIVGTALKGFKTFLEIRQMMKTKNHRRIRRRKPHAPSKRIWRSR